MPRPASGVASGCLLLVALLFWCVVPAGAATQDAAELRAALEAKLVEGEPLLQRERLSRFYQAREYQLGWIEADGAAPAAAELLRALDEADEEGLHAAVYHLQTLRRLLAAPLGDGSAQLHLDILLSDAFLAYALDLRRGRFDPRSVDDSWHIAPASYEMERMLRSALESGSVLAMLHSMPPYQSGYRRLRRALHDYRLIAAQGGWTVLGAGPPLQRGMRGARVAALREHLRQSGDLPRDAAAAGAAEEFDAMLELAVRRFQQRHGLPDDGVVGEESRVQLNVPVEQRIAQLLANMERWRWLPRHLASHYLMVSMTGFQLDVMEEDRSMLHMRVIIGSDYRQTPVFDSQVTEVIFNPSWFVPANIFRHDLLPQIRADHSYLARHNMMVLDELPSGGRSVDPQTIDWSLYASERFPYTLRQGPGEGNPLGRVKFLIPNNHGIYLHDTSQRALFAQRERTFSSGCIRLEKPLELASYLLKYEPGMDGNLSAYLAKTRTQTVKLSQSWPVYLLYWTAWVDEDGVVQFRDDVYNRDTRLIAQLTQSPFAQLSQSRLIDPAKHVE